MHDQICGVKLSNMSDLRRESFCEISSAGIDSMILCCREAPWHSAIHSLHIVLAGAGRLVTTMSVPESANRLDEIAKGVK